MRKLLFIAVLLFGGSALMAQTNFRNITYKEAVAAAKAENKRVFIDFYTTWCGPCKMMSEQMFPQKSMGDFFNPHFVCIKIDAEKGEGVELAKRFNTTVFPTFIALDADENVLVRKLGAEFDVEKFTTTFERALDPEKSPERLKARYNGGERTADLISAYTTYLVDESSKENGLMSIRTVDTVNQIMLDYFNGLTDKQKLAAENQFVYERYIFPTPLDPLGRFIVAHREEFDPAIREQINQHLEKLYKEYVASLLAGNLACNATDFATVKKEINELGYNDDKRLDPAFRLIESFAKGDLIAYFDCCDEEYDRLSEDDIYCILFGLYRIETDDPVVLKRAAEFLRSHLSTIPDIYKNMAKGRLEQFEARISELE